MSFRKALDAATRHRIKAVTNLPGLEAVLGCKLKPRIDWLHAEGKLTDELQAGAHLMREEGNDAAHKEEPYTPEEAKDLRYLTEVFLMYIFTIPGKIAERHPKLEEEVQGQEAARGEVYPLDPAQA